MNDFVLMREMTKAYVVPPKKILFSATATVTDSFLDDEFFLRGKGSCRRQIARL